MGAIDTLKELVTLVQKLDNLEPPEEDGRVTGTSVLARYREPRTKAREPAAE